jgi:hypothetical protein
MVAVPLSSSGGWLKATSRPSPTETDGTALGTKKITSRTRRRVPPRRRSANVAQVPQTSAAQLASAPVATLTRSWPAESPCKAPR